MSSTKLLGNRIREKRLQKNLSQQQLADLIYVTRKAVGNWEAGIRTPDVIMLNRLARVLDVEINDLLDFTETDEDQPCVIVVDDEPLLLKGSVRMLNETFPDLQVFGFHNADEAIEFTRGNPVNVAMLDIELRGVSGLEVADLLIEYRPRINIIFVTGHGEYTGEAWKKYASGYVMKPLTPEKIRQEFAHLRYPLR